MSDHNRDISQPQPLQPFEELAAFARDRDMLASTLGSLTVEQNMQIVDLSFKQTELEREATTDSLTGLPNRLGISRKIDELIETHPGEIGVLFIDLDGLKAINDRDGHHAGDHFIKGAAEVLRNNVRTTSEDREPDSFGMMPARLSGDEFVCLISGVSTEEQLEKVGARLRKALDSAGISASLGPALHQPGETSAQVIERADEAMYEIKADRRELRQDMGRDSLPKERRELYDRLALELWGTTGASFDEFNQIYGSGGR